MKRLNRILIILTITIISSSLVGCRNAGITNSDRVEIYQLIIRTVILGDNNYGKPIDIKHLYILENTDDGFGDEEIPSLPSQELDQEVMQGLETQLSNIASNIIWVNSRNEVPKSSDGAEVEDGAIITLGNIRRKNNSEVYVSIGIYFANLGGSSTTYILERENDVWTIRQKIGGSIA